MVEKKSPITKFTLAMLVGSVLLAPSLAACEVRAVFFINYVKNTLTEFPTQFCFKGHAAHSTFFTCGESRQVIGWVELFLLLLLFSRHLRTLLSK